MTRAKPETLLKPRQIAVSVAACFAFHSPLLLANPVGPTVVHGGVGFSGLGTSALTITNQAGGNAIINWHGFSIGINELTKFQQFANQAVLNRVTGSQLSSILGALQSDGRVFLINPNGIVFGASARIDTAGMVASSLGLSDQDFLANRLRFTEIPGAGAVVNNGVIQTAAGGRVYLVAPTVENNGLIQTPQGAITLAAGREIELVDANAPYLTVKVAAAADSAVNVGSLVADSGRIGMFGTLVRNAGTVAANGVVAGPGGEIRLVASKDLTVEAGSTVTANGVSGGSVVLQAEGGTNLVGGTVEAKGSAGKGGEVQALGVRVGVVGHGVIDASGDTGGGTVLVGGDYQGKNAAVQNAESTSISSDGVIRADAMTTGDGGRVIVWADENAEFHGSIAARGGARSGNGGFVETSGKRTISIAGGRVDLRAPKGAWGDWLLDPEFFVIDSATATTIESNFSSVGSFTATAYGYIDFESSLSLSYGGGGAFNAFSSGDIKLNSFAIAAVGSEVNIMLAANDARGGGPATGTGSITSTTGGDITTGGGSLTATGVAVTLGTIDTRGPSSNGGGSVSIESSNGVVNTGGITTGGGGIGITAYGVAGNVTVGGVIDTSNIGLPDDNIGNGAVNIRADGSITTRDIITKSTHPGYGDGGVVTLTAGEGVIVVSGTIDTRGANGERFSSSSYYAGTAGGSVFISRLGASALGAPAVHVTGSILTDGGNGASTDVEFANGDRSGGSGGSVTIWAGQAPLTGDVVIGGTISTRGGNGGSTLDRFSDTNGESGGGVQIWATGSVSVGSIVTRGGVGGDGSEGGSIYDNWGGAGGSIDIDAGGAVVLGVVDASGGAGGNADVASYGGFEAIGGTGGWGGAVSISGASISATSIASIGGNGGAGGGSASAVDYAFAGDGGYGGSINLSSGGAISMNSIASAGGAGGAGGFGFSDAHGGNGGDGARVDVNAYGAVDIGSINTSGGAAGNGGATDSGMAYGGNGGQGGLLYVSGTQLSIGSMYTRGGAGGHGGTQGLDDQAGGGFGGEGGGIELSTSNGSIAVSSIDTGGGNGGSGGVAMTYASGGDGGESGSVEVYTNAASGSISVGSIMARGGAGGAGGSTDSEFSGTAAWGGDGGNGFGVYFSAQGLISVGSIDASSGSGGAGGYAVDATGGSGGTYAYVSLYSNTSITAGAISARGGDGGAGGTAQDATGDASGGQAGQGGTVYVQTPSGTPGPVTTGVIDASGGNGGNGGVGADLRNGGGAGSGGYVSYYGSTIAVKGPIFARGGTGGAGSPLGGSGGAGGTAWIIGTDLVGINLGGTLGAVAIDVSGGAGGAGYAAASPAGDGGAGGSGGYAYVVGRPDMTLFGSVLAGGGAGGAAGAGNAANPGGAGGVGGNSGAIYLDASSTGNSQLGDGIIFVLAGTQFNVQGGAGGAGGVDGGAGAGVGGTAGMTGTFNSMSDYFGTIVILDPLSIPEVNSAFQQTVQGIDESTVVVGDESDKDEDEDKSKKEFGSCKA